MANDPKLTDTGTPEPRRIEVKVDYMVEGATLAGDTYDENHNFLYPAYTSFTGEILKSLVEKGVHLIYYTPVPEEEKGIERFRDRADSIMDMLLDAMNNNRRPDFFAAKRLVRDLYEYLSSYEKKLLELMEIQEYDDYTYTHSVNVGLLSMALAGRHGLDHNMQMEIGYGAFLHDIGKLTLSREILLKAGKLTDEDYEAVKQHSRKGAEYLSRYRELSESAISVIHQHHEWYNGKGYPDELPDDKLHMGARLTSICDVYDALTTEKTYRKAHSPREAISIIMKMSRLQFNPVLVARFIREIVPLVLEEPLLPVGTLVVLNTGEIARVVEIHSERDVMPVISIIYDASRQRVKRPIRVDLTMDGTRSIHTIVPTK